MVKFCRQCGAALSEGAAFCRNCGTSVQAAAPAAAVTVPVTKRSYLDPPPATATAAPRQGTDLWDIQTKLQPTADKVCVSISKWAPPESSFGKPLHRMVRAAFLDQATFQQTAADTTLTMEAAICLLIPLLAVAVGPAITSLLMGHVALTWLIALLAVQVASMAAFVLGVAYGAPYIIGRSIDPLFLFRPVAYAQSAGIFGFLPVVGALLSLWRLPTTVAAIKDSVACDTGKAVTLLIVGIVCGSIASALLGPPLLRYLGGL